MGKGEQIGFMLEQDNGNNTVEIFTFENAMCLYRYCVQSTNIASTSLILAFVHVLCIINSRKYIVNW